MLGGVGGLKLQSFGPLSLLILRVSAVLLRHRNDAPALRPLLPPMPDDQDWRQEEERQQEDIRDTQTHEHPELAQRLHRAQEVREEAEGRCQGGGQATFAGLDQHPCEASVDLPEVHALSPEVKENENDVDIDNRDQKERHKRREGCLRGRRADIGKGNGCEDHEEGPEHRRHAADVHAHVERHEEDGTEGPHDVCLHSQRDLVIVDAIA
mmetsp:Transcript_27067/g.72109  ORF Transcript_27067/g.72109 Transcript_27067/m.72109 type:complete len:210 (-) Transcript_27067:421-1050(-)